MKKIFNSHTGFQPLIIFVIVLIQYLNIANLGPHFLRYRKNNPFLALVLLSHKLSPNYSCHSTPEEFLPFLIGMAHIYYHLAWCFCM